MILLLLGRSGCGKSSIAERLIKNYGYAHIITCTTRKIREYESENAYHFMSVEEFCKHINAGDFVEYDTYGDNMYGTLKSSFNTGEKLVCIITPEGAAAIKREFPDTFVVNVETDMKTSVIWAIEREKNLTPDKLHTIERRANKDYFLYDNLSCDFTVENGPEASLDKLAQIIADAHTAYKTGKQ